VEALTELRETFYELENPLDEAAVQNISQLLTDLHKMDEYAVRFSITEQLQDGGAVQEFNLKISRAESK